MQTAPVLHWELYGGGAALSFRAERDDNSYSLTLRRGDALVMTAVASDQETLLTKSAGLRRALQDFGFQAAPADDAGMCRSLESLDVAVLRAVR